MGKDKWESLALGSSQGTGHWGVQGVDTKGEVWRVKGLIVTGDWRVRKRCGPGQKVRMGNSVNICSVYAEKPNARTCPNKTRLLHLCGKTPRSSGWAPQEVHWDRGAGRGMCGLGAHSSSQRSCPFIHTSRSTSWACSTGLLTGPTHYSGCSNSDMGMPTKGLLAIIFLCLIFIIFYWLSLCKLPEIYFGTRWV